MLKTLLELAYAGIQKTLDTLHPPPAHYEGWIRNGSVLNPPNLLSLLRIPLGVVVWQWAGTHSAASVLGILALAMLTDILDGYLARRFEWTTIYGVILDPWCDKVFFLFCAWGYRTAFLPWIFWPLASIEGLILAAPLFAAMFLRNREVEFSSNIYGKSKFAAECFALLAAIFRQTAAASGLLAAALALAVMSIMEQIKRQPAGRLR